MGGWRGSPPPFYPAADHTSEERCELSVVIPSKLFITNFRGAESIDELKRIGCTHIAAVGTEFMHNQENHAATALKIKFWNKDITDDEEQGASMGASLKSAARFIKKALKKKHGCVLVHCAAGISRSASVVLGYLVLHGGKSLREAFAHLLQCRPCIWPNEGFMSALIDLEKAERGKATITAAEYEHCTDASWPCLPMRVSDCYIVVSSIVWRFDSRACTKCARGRLRRPYD